MDLTNSTLEVLGKETRKLLSFEGLDHETLCEGRKETSVKRFRRAMDWSQVGGVGWGQEKLGVYR